MQRQDSFPCRLLLLAASVAASAAPAYSQIETPLASEAVALDRALDRGESLHLDRVGETLWARGRTYKASLDRDGFTYIPFLGSRAPRNWPISFRLRAARAGHTDLALETGDAAFEGETAVLDRGTVQARYHLSSRSVEQTFVVAKESIGAGELVLELAISTDLAITRDGRALVFSGPDGAVRFGAATVLDGAGRSLALPTEWDGETLTFRVPSEFVESAVDAIVVDPVISTTTVDGFNLELTRPDVAYDTDENTFCVLYEESFSATDSDLYYRTLNGTTLAVEDQGYFDSTTDRTYGPHLATIASTDRFVAVYTVDDAFGLPEIHTRSRLAAPGSLWGTDYTVAAPTEFFTYENPDVGGEAFEGSGTSNAAVVFEQRARGAGNFTHGIRARLIGSDGVPAPSLTNIAPALGPMSLTQPRISKYSGDPFQHGAWWIACMAGPAGAPATEIHTTRLDYTGATSELDQLTWGSSNSDPLDHLEVSSPHTGWLDEVFHITFDVTGSGGDTTLILTRARTGLGPLLPAWPIHQKDCADGTPKRFGALATTSDRAMLTYYDRTNPGGPHELRSSTMELPSDLSAGVGERRTLLGSLNQAAPSAPTAAASKASGGVNASSQQVFVVWEDEGTAGGDSDIFGALVNLTAPRVAASTFCRSGKNSTGDRAFLAAYGDNGLVSPKTMIVSGLPTFTLGYFLASRTAAVSYPAGTQGILCLGGSVGRYAGNVLNAGAGGRFIFNVFPTALASPTGSVAAVAGQRWHFQAWYRDANPSVTSNFTNAVTIRF